MAEMEPSSMQRDLTFWMQTIHLQFVIYSSLDLKCKDCCHKDAAISDMDNDLVISDINNCDNQCH